MSRVDEAFAAARAEGRGLLVAYLPAGFPTLEGSYQAVQAVVDAGADLIEIGLPYSDPVMDGPTVQAAAEQALEAGTRTRDVLRLVERVSRLVPTVVMTYWNPVERYGVAAFARDLAAAGGSGLITPDLIPEEAGEWLAESGSNALDRIFLVAPSSTDARLRATAAASSGFVYAAAVMGVTGAREQSSTLAPELVRRTRAVTDLPVAVGLGVSTADQAAEVASYADGVIVGSALVRSMLQQDAFPASLRAVGGLAAELAEGVRRAAPGTSAGSERLGTV